MGTLARERLGTEPVKRLMFRMAAPSIVAMIMQALYNMIDSVFVGKISAASLAAVTLAFPVTMFTGAISTGIGVGINSSIARGLGEGDPDRPSKSAANGLALGVISFAVMFLFGIFGAGWFVRMYSTEEQVIADGIIYIRTLCMLSFGQIFTQISFSILQGSGNMIFPLFSQIAGAASVLILDPLLILVFHLGVRGAALASGCAQIVSMAVGLFGVFVKNRKNLPVTLRSFRPEWKVIKDILAVGVPSALTQATTSIVGGIINKVISRYGSVAISVYGGYSKISTFGVLPVFGVTRGMTPILGYSYGAKNRDRFLQTRRIAIFTAFCISSLAGLFFVLLPGVVLNMISATDEMRRIGMTAYRILGTSLFISGISIVCSQCFPPAKRSYLTMIYSLCRQIGLLLPIMLLLTRLMGMTGVWLSYVITDYVGFGIVTAMSIWFRKKVLDTWPAVVENDNISKETTATEESDK